MSSSVTCANCGRPLPADQPGDGGYCATCTAAWSGGSDPDSPLAADVATDPHGSARLCTNCGTPLPAGRPANHGYCDACTARWQRGRATGAKPDS